MITHHWCNDVSSLANKVLNEIKVSKPKILPVTEDVKVLNDFIMNKAQEAYDNLENDINSTSDYKVLIECILVQVMIFNRKRVGGVQFLEIKSYQAETTIINQKEMMDALTDHEKTICSAFKRVVVFGKGSKPVPLLFTKLIQRYIQIILRVRDETDIVPKSNPYLFANPNCADRWVSGPSVIRKYAYMCGAKNPETLTSTRFRKQIATILQIMNFEDDEMQQIATFMGHTEKTLREFYRLPEDIYQTAKVAKVLLLLNEGKGKEFKGKSLADIEISEDLLEIEQKEDNKDEECEKEVNEKETNSQTDHNKNTMSQMDYENMNDVDCEDMNGMDCGDMNEMDSEKTSNTFQSNSSSTDVVTKSKKAKQKLHIWSGEEKQLVLKHF
ncbi:uncharacterized protein LOC123683842 [Harmonia axyridis]|uniref:uncharacterized protein LOC123683842 n=1 Tax=Harmonia axyridis TaxID=115357 RepID=UPI001E279506|nr:uncharacterized protein LOC123683842 [Harmonia axyridis]XP_045478748.1 uncharacterized protein LOC123683842 [Harmonia axyridis]XP_045478757.1 uncharacterized protein LOC123683842 [Harmonia axyridis]XP_045478767.1 uncharacterized protein LOC123683842 [Harmonia axyridis]